jgi:hypothetical protein
MPGPLTWPGRPAYLRGMKHVPESHQSIVPDRGVVIILAAIVVTMAIVYIVVTLAD